MSREALLLDAEKLALRALRDFVFHREKFSGLEIGRELLDGAEKSRRRLEGLVREGTPVYGVTTGFGDSCGRSVAAGRAEALQANLISYLLCGSGPLLSVEACRAIFVVRAKSLSRGYSGVSAELLERMALFLSNDWIPVIPREGSLGASGDLIPLAYLARCLQGDGQVYVNGRISGTAEVLSAAGVGAYTLKPKEGLALVNGTSAMAGVLMTRWAEADYLLRLSEMSTSWLCLALHGRAESFGELVNAKASRHRGQAAVAARITALLGEEGYPGSARAGSRGEPIQDRYSLRCAPQILGPIAETLECVEQWLEAEINGVSDNPLIGEDGALAVGGNFYGGYLSQGADYLKICLSHLADMADRQLAMLVDEKSNRGLPPNLANWPGIPEEERSLHHGLKGLHQYASALTSEILAKSVPNGIFSRSSECHNQDKVSLGMSAAIQCGQMSEQVFTLMSLHLICLAQGLDLRGIRLKGRESSGLYHAIREHAPFAEQDRPMDESVRGVAELLRHRARES